MCSFPQFRTRIRRRSRWRRYAAAGATEDDTAERLPDQVYGRQPATCRARRKFMLAVPQILPALSGCGQEIGNIAGRSVHARRVHHEHGEPVPSADPGGMSIIPTNIVRRLNVGFHTPKQSFQPQPVLWDRKEPYNLTIVIVTTLCTPLTATIVPTRSNGTALINIEKPKIVNGLLDLNAWSPDPSQCRVHALRRSPWNLLKAF